MSALRLALVVFRKELVDGLRDRRSVLTACMSPLVGVVMIGVTVAFIGKLVTDATQRPLDLPVAGMARAPDLMTFLREHNIRPAAEDRVPTELIRSGDAKVALVVPEAYGAALRVGKPAPLQLVYDRSATTASAQVARLEALLEQYSFRLGALRLIARGVDARIVKPVALERVDLSTPQSRSASLLYMVPILLVVTLFLGSVSVATDSTAGERERGSLEPLLINPIPRRALVAGKLLATLCFSGGALALLLVGLWLLPFIVSFTDVGGAFALQPAPAFALLLPLMVSFSAVQMLVASFARTFKEAQTTLSLLSILIMAPGAALALVPSVPRLWVFAIPIVSEEVLLARLVRGESVDPRYVAVAIAAGAAWACLAVAGVIRLYRSERLLFGKGGG